MPTQSFPTYATASRVQCSYTPQTLRLTYEQDMQIEQDNIRRKYEEVAAALREKTRKYLQTQELYDKLKRRSTLGHVQEAVADEVENTIQASVTANRFVDAVGNQSMRPQPPIFSEQQNNAIHRTGGAGPGSMTTPQIGRAPVPSGMHPPQLGRSNNGGWAGFSSQGSSNRRTFSA